MSLPFCSPQSKKKAFAEAVAALEPDMPLLMHGSGDVSAVNPDSARLVTELTVQYISNLVDAAVDAHDLLTDGAGGVLPPPAYPNKRKPTPPQKKKRKRAGVDYWDEPLPEPKIRSKESSQFPEANEIGLRKNVNQRVSVDEWVGLAGVDFWEEARSRSAHVSAPSAISTQCFIFPICHDAGLYGRVMEVQAARRSIAPVLTDNVWIEMIETEGGRLAHVPSTKKKAANEAETTDEPEDEDEEDNEEEVLPTWPGLESLLPTHQQG